MSIGFQLSKVLKNVCSESGNERTQRAMLLANTLAFQVNLVSETLDSAVEKYLPKLKKVVSSVNEHISVDSVLTQGLFVDILKIRFELINGTTDPTIMQLAIKSHSADLYLENIESSIGNALVSKTEFTCIQNNLSEILQGYDVGE